MGLFFNWDYPLMSATFSRAGDAVANFRRPTSCRGIPLKFESAGLAPAVDSAKWDKFMRAYDIQDYSDLDMSVCDDLPDSIRGAFWEVEGHDGKTKYVMVFNPRTANDNTCLHEGYHYIQSKKSIYRPWRLGYEASAMRFADRHEYEYQGIWKKTSY